jgi:cytochrome P450
MSTDSPAPTDLPAEELVGAPDGEPGGDRFAVLREELERADNDDLTSRRVEGPVSDYAVDFDHTGVEWVADPFPIWADLRERCPVAHSDRYGGAWLPTRHADVSAIAHDTERFTSRSVVVGNHRPPSEVEPVGVAPPITSDPPFHAEARRILLPAFSPKAVERLEPITVELCDSLLDSLEGRDVVDAAAEYAQHIPMRIIATMLGFPPEDEHRFAVFVHNVLEGVNDPPEVRFGKIQELFVYLTAQIDDHLENPRDDLTSYLIAAEMEGRKLDPFHIAGTMALLLLAGIDTTWSAIGASLWHLGGNPEDLARLVAEPDLMPTAIEELLRAYSPVTMARMVKQDMDFEGCPMKADDWVLLCFPSANRDREFFEDADEVLIDRTVNRHAAFGLGVHRCIGSNLARMELRVALQRWLARFPEFSLADPGSVTWSAGQVRGPRTLPIRLGAPT